MREEHYRKLISLYVDNELSAIEEKELLSHIEVCEDCSKFLMDLLYIKSEIKKSYKREKTIDISASVMKKIKDNEENNSEKVIPINKKQYRRKKFNKYYIKKTIGFAFLAIIFLGIAFFITNKYSKNSNNIENYVVEHLDTPTYEYMPDINNANFSQ
ncbi:MAG: zf-HC2 domain-containing protein [Deferribacterota bacterium]|nr:zf-HC2 domain-containing protein [Deferribacterota bacterium]